MSRFSRFLKTTRFAFYCQLFLSSWGDRMWHFATGVLLTSMTGGSDGTVIRGAVNLKLAAIYGFCSCVATVLFGSMIGGWIDKGRRRRTALTCIFIQNSSVALSAVAMCGGLIRKRMLIEAEATGADADPLLIFLQAAAIAFAVLADLASAGSKISISKDWLVVVYGSDKRKLTLINASLRRIDLSCRVISPVVCGLVMNFISLFASAIAIAGWNVVSMVFECLVLRRIYRLNAALATPKVAKVTTKSKLISALNHRIVKHHADANQQSGQQLDVTVTESAVDDIKQLPFTNADLDENEELPMRTPHHKPAKVTARTKSDNDKASCCLGCVMHTLDSLLGIFRGWRAYYKQPCMLLGLALALLYANAICYDQVTMGYAFSQSMPEVIISVVGGAVSLTGIAGTFLFPVLRRHCGLILGCLIALLAEFIALLPCVASVWTEGSPFDPSFVAPQSDYLKQNFTSVVNSEPNGTYRCTTDSLLSSSLCNSTIATSSATNSTAVEFSLINGAFLNTSLILLMTGVVLSRIGLWCADLSISQIYLEVVPENERGKVHGAQFSLDKVMEMIKYILVLTFPYPQQFGYLICISEALVGLSVVCSAIHACRNCGKLRAEVQEMKKRQVEAQESEAAEATQASTESPEDEPADDSLSLHAP